MRHKRFWFATIGMLAVLALDLMLPTGIGAASTYKVLYKFGGGAHGGYPSASMIFDAAGNLYGTTQRGGSTSTHCSFFNSCGVVFKLTPKSDGSWTESVLHSFAFSDGANPYGGLIFDATGNLYGTTYYGGPNGAGVVFKLKPNADGSWTENVLYSFCAAFNCSDGANPSAGLIFDTAGNLYGTTQTGGFTSTACGRGCGVVFKLTPNTDGSWTESVLHSFTQVPDGSDPYAGLIFDPAGNLYGTTGYGGGTNNTGVVFELKPNADGSWTESVLYSFTGFSDGANPYGGLIFDATGNLYGTTYGGNPGAVVFKLKPNADGSWTESVLHSFPLNFDPTAGLIFDTAGNLYGTIYFGGPAGGGGIFKLAHNSNGSWAYRGLRFFFGNPAQNPYGGLVLDKAGNLYGTTYGCGNGCAGVVFEVTP